MIPKSKKSKSQKTKKAYKKKIIFQYKQSPKNFSDPIGPKKIENELKKPKKNQKIRKPKFFKNEIYQFTLVNPQKLLRPHPDPKKISR